MLKRANCGSGTNLVTKEAKNWALWNPRLHKEQSGCIPTQDIAAMLIVPCFSITYRYYTIRYRERNRKWIYQTCPTSDTVIDNLKPNTPYEFGVRSNKDDRRGTWSKPVIHNTNMGGETLIYLYQLLCFDRDVAVDGPVTMIQRIIGPDHLAKMISLWPNCPCLVTQDCGLKAQLRLHTNNILISPRVTGILMD